VRIVLYNVTSEPITLVAKWDSDRFNGHFKDCLYRHISFETYPDVRPRIFQTVAGRREKPETTTNAVLSGSDSLVVEWTAKGGALRDEKDDIQPGGTPIFPLPGLYSVRASAVLETSGGNTFRLTSNEDQVPTGGSTRAPRHTYGEVVSVDSSKGTAMINLGMFDGVRNGDRFEIILGLCEKSWYLTITDVGRHYSEGPVKAIPKGAPLLRAVRQEVLWVRP
jgi:hypothetical protein